MDGANKELKALTVILRASQAIQEVIRKDVAVYGLNPTEFAVLEMLYYKGDQPIQTVGKKILITSSITYVIDKLEKKQFVSRKNCSNDRRITYASLTAKGENLIEQIFPKHQEKIQKVFECLESADLDETIKLMKKIGFQAEKL